MEILIGNTSCTSPRIKENIQKSNTNNIESSESNNKACTSNEDNHISNLTDLDFVESWKTEKSFRFVLGLESGKQTRMKKSLARGQYLLVN